MTEFSMKVAARVVKVSAMFDSSKEYCKGYFCDQQPDFSVELTAADIAFERDKSLKTNIAECVSPRKLSDAQLEITAIQRKIAEGMFAYDTLLFHGSAVAVDDKAYLFTAKSGTGKSTHTKLWRQLFGNRALMINDDKPFLRILPDGVLVCGSPWNGKHKLGNNVMVPLKAICILERGEENSISRVSAEEAVPMLLQQSNRPTKAPLVAKYMELLDALAGSVEFYRLQCNTAPDAAEVAYHAMRD